MEVLIEGYDIRLKLDASAKVQPNVDSDEADIGQVPYCLCNETKYDGMRQVVASRRVLERIQKPVRYPAKGLVQ